MALGLAGNGEEKLEFWGELVLGVKAVGEVNTADTAVSVNLNSKKFKKSVTSLIYGIQTLSLLKTRAFKSVCANFQCLPEGFNVVGTVSTTGEIRQVELNLIPAFVETHGHGADERLHTGSGLIVRSAETTAHVLVIQNLHLEGEVLLQLYPAKIDISFQFGR